MAFIVGSDALALLLHVSGFYLLTLMTSLPWWGAILIMCVIFFVIGTLSVFISEEYDSGGELLLGGFVIGLLLPGMILAFFFKEGDADSGHETWAELLASLFLYLVLFYALASTGFAMNVAIIAAATLLAVQLIILAFAPVAVHTPGPERRRALGGGIEDSSN